MKTFNNVLLVIATVLFFSSLSFSQGISINNDGSGADGSAMLDVKSTTSGLLVPRMTTVQRIAIVSPANSLMVFDIDTKSFWFYNVTEWNEVGASKVNMLSDNDGDTKIVLENSADEDVVRIQTAGTERLVIDDAGVTKVGDPLNFTQIEQDGSLSLQGDATVFNDLLVPVTSTRRGGTKDPNFNILKNNGSGSQGVFTYWFDDSTEEELYFVVQMPHSWKEGSDIFPHVHWVTKTDLGAAKVEWALEYTWVNVGDVFGNTVTISAFDPIPPVVPVTAYKHAITDLPTISSSGYKISSMIMCRVYRNATSVNDTYTSKAGLLQIDFHYETDAMGSRTEYTK